MEFRNVGRTGLKVSALCLGSMQFGWTADEATAFQVLSAAWEAGINFIDTADIYSRWVQGNPGGVAETIIGKWMKQAQIPRGQVIIATKVHGKMGDGPNDLGLSRLHILQAVEASLRRLQVDYIDLYQSHDFDPAVPIDETLRAFDDLVRQGKVRYVACSNYPAWRLMQALWTSDARGWASYVCLQPHYNMVHRGEFERELMDVCRTYGLGVIPYSPLAGGFLTGKYHRDHTDAGSRRNSSRYFTERNWGILEKIEQVGAELGGKSVSQVSLAWMLANPVITAPIVGPRSVEQLQDNLGAVDIKLPAEMVEKLNEVSKDV